MAEPRRNAATQKPILVTGAPRSGTTWVGKMLALAPGVGYIHEPFSPRTDAGIAGKPFARFFAYATGEDPSVERRLARSFAFSYDLGAQLRSIRSPRDVARTVRDGTYFARMRRAGARPLVKDPIAVFSAEWLAATFDMDVVVTVRNPFAFVASFKRLGWHHDFGSFLAEPRLLEDHLAGFEPEIREFAERPGAVVDEATLLWRLVHHAVETFRGRHPEWHFVRHEDLSRDPVWGFEELYRACGLALTPVARAGIASHSATDNPGQLDHDHAVRLDSERSLDNWRAILTPVEADLVREQTQDVAAAFYTPEELSPSR